MRLMQLYNFVVNEITNGIKSEFICISFLCSNCTCKYSGAKFLHQFFVSLQLFQTIFYREIGEHKISRTRRSPILLSTVVASSPFTFLSSTSSEAKFIALNQVFPFLCFPSLYRIEEIRVGLSLLLWSLAKKFKCNT